MKKYAVLFFLAVNLAFQATGGFAQNNRQSMPHPEARDYHVPLRSEDKENIRYLILTLANKSQISLLFAKSRLNRAGNAVSHVHPLVFFAYVFTDPELKSAVKRIQGTPWRRFVEGMGDNFAKEAKRGNVTEEQLRDFASKVGVDYSLLATTAQRNQWGEFINITRDRL